MKFSLKIASLTVGLILILSCGGGGGGISVPPDQTSSFVAKPGQVVSSKIGSKQVTALANAYASPTTVDLRLSASIPSRPANPRFKIDDGLLTVSAATAPQTGLKVTCPTPSSSQPVLALVRQDSQWQATTSHPQGDDLYFWLTANNPSAPAPVQLPSIHWEAISGWFEEVSGDEAASLTRLAGTGGLGSGSAIVIHGICDRKESMATLAQRLVAVGGYKNVFGLGYDWQLATPVAAADLADRLNSLSVVKGIDIWAHSRGVLLARYALEKLGATRPIRRAVFMNGPNKGSLWSSPVSVMYGFINVIINSPIGSSLPRGTEPALAELGSNSAFTQSLNTSYNRQRGNVDYWLVAAKSDVAVGESSSRADGVNLSTLTEGEIERLTVSGGHSTLLHDQSAIDNLIAKVLPLFESTLQITAAPNPNPADDYGWGQTITTTNNLNEDIILQELAIDHYDRNGYWGNRQWWKPGLTGVFPTNYLSFAVTVRKGTSYEVTTTTTNNGIPLSDWDPSWQAQTGIYSVRAKGVSSSRQYDARVGIVKYSSYGFPEAANTRRPHGLPSGPLRESATKR